MTVPGWGTGPAAEPRTPRTPVADIFEETFRLYRRNFLLMVGVLAVFYIPIAVVAAPFELWQLQWSLGPLYSDPPLGNGAQPVLPSADQIATFVVTALVFAVVALVLSTFGNAAIAYIVGRARHGDAPPAREVFLALRRLAGPLLAYVAILLVGVLLVFIAAGLAIVIVAVLVAGVLGGPGGAGLAALLSVVGLLALIVVGIAVMIRLSLAIPALVLERQRALDAFRRSWNLVRGSAWRTLGIFLLAGILVALVSSLVSPIFLPGVLQGAMTGSLLSYAIVTVIGTVVQVLIGPIIPILLTVLYFDYAGRSASSAS